LDRYLFAAVMPSELATLLAFDKFLVPAVSESLSLPPVKELLPAYMFVWRDKMKNYKERFERRRDEERVLEEMKKDFWKVV